MYLSIISSIFGILFIFCGIAGFIPGLFSNDLLFGYFHVDMIHNVANFVVGVIALVASLQYKRDKLFFQVFGVLFGILAILGFVWQGNLFFTSVNMADSLLHLVLALIFLILGFSAKKDGHI
jgi:hypothetical protein